MSNSIEISKIAEFCNMSRETILRFIEADYIKVLKRDEDKIFVNANEACTLFGVNPKKLLDENKVKEEKVKADKAKALKEKTSEKKIETKEKEKPVEVSRKITKTETPTKEEEIQYTSDALAKRLNELQEQLLKKQDLEIEDLKKQREWLKARIEILEQKLDREQLLLLSQTQVVNQLIKKETNKSPLQKALAWFGVEKENSSTNNDNVVEMKDAKMKTKKDVA